VNGTAARLQWRCRRGTRELDTLLSGFLSHGYLDLTAAQCRLFEDLLERDDDQLWRYFFDADCAIPTELSSLVAAIRSSLPD
jgi:antitoxin CptB